MGALRWRPPVEPKNAASPKLKMPPSGGHQPVPLTRRRGRHADDRRIERGPAHAPVGVRVAEGIDAACRRGDPVAAAVGRGGHGHRPGRPRRRSRSRSRRRHRRRSGLLGDARRAAPQQGDEQGRTEREHRRPTTVDEGAGARSPGYGDRRSTHRQRRLPAGERSSCVQNVGEVSTA